MSVREILEGLEIFRNTRKYGLLPFNEGRPFELWHIYKTDYNKHNVTAVTTDQIDLYFPYPECYWCPIDEPQCSKPESCMFNVHYRMKGKVNPVVECKVSDDPRTVGLSRGTMIFNFNYEIKNHMFRPTFFNKCVLHHYYLSSFDDREIRVLMKGPHRKKHSLINASMKRIITYGEIINNGSMPDKIEIAKIQLQRENELLTKLKDIENDPEIMRIIYEIDDRIKLGYL